MAQIFKAKTLVANSGKFAYEVSAPNLVSNTGDQNIGGNKTFELFPIVSGNKLITGVDLTSYATNANLYTTGSALDNKINSLSGYVNSQDILFSGQIFNTGSRLDSKINSLSGYVDSKSIVLPNSIVYTTGDQLIFGNKTFLDNLIVSGSGIFNALDLNNIDVLSLSGVDISLKNGNVSLTNRPTVNGTGVVLSGELNPIIVNTGSLLNNKINSLSGYVNSQDLFFSGQVFNTGSRLDSKINSLSGYVNSQDIIFSGQISLSGSNLNDKIISLSGLFTTYTGNLDANFASDAQLFATGSILDNKINSLSGYVNSQDSIFSGQTFNTGSILDSKINSLSGYVNSQNIIFSGQTALTGSTLDNKINALSGYVSGISAGGGLPSTIVYITGDQLISGNKTFLNNIAVSGTGNFNNVKVSNIDKLFLSGIDIVITGNSSINVYNAIYISGNSVLTGAVQLSSYATVANLFETGSTLDNKINSLSGYVNSQDLIFSGQTASTGSLLDNKINTLSGNLTGNYASITNLFSTGSALDNKINSLSGYINTQDIIFSGQIFNTGSRLDNKINSLSGYVDSKSIVLPTTIVYTTGNQTIFGNKTFRDTLSVRTISGLSGVGNATSIDIKAIDNAQLAFGTNYVGGNINLTAGSGNLIGGRIGLYAGALESEPYNGEIEVKGDINLNPNITRPRSINIWKTGVGGSLPFGTTNVSINQNFVNVNNALFVSGNPVLTGLHTLYATSNNLASTGSILDNKINSLSGSSVLIFGDQNVFGIKTFASRPTVNGTGVLLSGEAANITLPNTIVYTTGNQIISGNKTFLDNLIVSGSGIFNALDLNNIDVLSLSGVDISITNGNVSLTNRPTVNGTGVVLSGELDPIIVNTGSLLNNKINSLSGYVNSQDIIFSGQTFNTGSRLDNKINSLSGHLNSQDIVFSGQIALTGSILDNKINSISGYVNSKDLIFSGQTASTGSLLDNKINALSGNLTGNYASITNLFSTGSQLATANNNYSGWATNTYATIINLATTGSTLDNKINSLSGYVTGITGTFGSLPTNLFLTGSTLDSKINSLSGYVNSQDSIFSGQTFNTGSRLDNKINSLSGYLNSQDIIFSGQIASTGSSLYNSILSLSGLFTGYTGNLDSNFASDAQLFNTGSILDNKINSLSGYVNSLSTSGQVFNTGSILDSKINSLSGYVNAQDIIFSGQTFNTGSRLDNKINSLSGYVDTKDIVLSGQIASTGSNLYNSIISLSGLFTGYTGLLDATFASDAQLFTTGSILDNKINSLSGYVNSQDNLFSGQIFDTGSRLDNKINSLSGYVNSQDVIFSGQIFNTGSRLDNKINSLSGYVDSKSIVLPTTIVYTTGNQTISGTKTFLDNIAVSGTGNFNNVKVSSIDKLFLSGIDMVVTGNSSINVYNAIYISGNPVLTGIIPSSQTLANVVYTTGNQNINGTKTFLDNIAVSGTGNFNNVKVSSIDKLFLSGIDIIITGNSSINVYNAIYISGNPVLTGTIPTAQTISNVVYTTGDQTISGIKTFTETGSFDTLQITNKKLSSYNYLNSNFTFDNIYINIVNSSNNVIGTLPSDITSGINYYVKNLNTGVLIITGSNQRTIDGFYNINLYKNESLQLLGVNNIGYTGWVTLSADNGVS